MNRFDPILASDNIKDDHLFLQFQDKKTVKKINELVKDKIRF